VEEEKSLKITRIAFKKYVKMSFHPSEGLTDNSAKMSQVTVKQESTESEYDLIPNHTKLLKTVDGSQSDEQMNRTEYNGNIKIEPREVKDFFITDFSKRKEKKKKCQKCKKCIKRKLRKLKKKEKRKMRKQRLEEKNGFASNLPMNWDLRLDAGSQTDSLQDILTR